MPRQNEKSAATWAKARIILTAIPLGSCNFGNNE